jgi:hypothetical protein
MSQRRVTHQVTQHMRYKKIEFCAGRRLPPPAHISLSGHIWCVNGSGSSPVMRAQIGWGFMEPLHGT